MAVGGFDIEQFKYPSIEDIELGYRIRAAGGRILVLKNLQVHPSQSMAICQFVAYRVLPSSTSLVAIDAQSRTLLNDLNVSVMERFRAMIAIFLLLSIFASAFNHDAMVGTFGLVVYSRYVEFQADKFFLSAQRLGFFFE